VQVAAAYRTQTTGGRPRNLFWRLQPPVVAAGRYSLQEGRQGAPIVLGAPTRTPVKSNTTIRCGDQRDMARRASCEARLGGDARSSRRRTAAASSSWAASSKACSLELVRSSR
jgi:hypothetical protein